jgi:DNA-binding winged helix-turn-helix (wHTH) protein
VRLRFRDCTLDTGTRTLTRKDTEVPLAPKVYALLEVLVTERPNAVSHDRLRARLWPDAVTGGTTIARLVNELRAALGDHDDSDPVLRTVHRFGYAFSGTVVEETPAVPVAVCAIKWGTLFVPLTRGEHLIGRAATNLIPVPSSQVSREHSRIRVSAERVTLEDLGSRNGTFVNDHRIASTVTLKQGDRIGIGPAMMVFSAAPDDATTSRETSS